VDPTTATVEDLLMMTTAVNIQLPMVKVAMIRANTVTTSCTPRAATH